VKITVNDRAKVVTISLQPALRICGKNGSCILFANRATQIESHENLARLQMKKLNLIRRQVIKLRQRNGWTQEEFAVQLQLAGWHNATRSTVSKIEGGSMGVAEYDLLFIAAALRVHFVHLFPPIDWQRPMDENVHKHIPHELHGFADES
jgi:DNA-binding XRE family transcriptional regulator